MALVYQNLTLEVTPGMLPPVLHVTEYDINMQIDVTFVQRGQPYEIPSGTTAKVEGTIAGHPFRESCVVNGNTVTFILTKNMTAYSGRAWTKIVLTNNNWPVSTCGFWLDCDRAGVEAETVIGAPGFEEQIKEAAEDWLEEQGFQSPTVSITPITGGNRVTFTDAQHPQGQSIDVMDGEDTGVVTDDTLTIEGAAADAAVTGSLAERQTVVQTIENTPTWSVGYIAVNGSVNSSTSYQHTDKIPVVAGDVVHTYNESDPAAYHAMRFVCAYNGDSAVSASGASNSPREYVVPDGIDGIVVTITANATGTNIVGITRNSEIFVPKGVPALQEQAEALQPVADSLIESPNLYDASAATHGKLLAANGNASDSTDYQYTGFIPVSGGDVIRFRSFRSNGQITPYYRCIAAYDSTRFILSAKGTNTGAYTSWTVPDGVSYIRATVYDNADVAITANEDIPVPFLPYGGTKISAEAVYGDISDCVPSIEYLKSSIGNNAARVEAASVQSGGRIALSDFPYYIKKNVGMSFTAIFSGTFSGITIGKGGSGVYRASYLVIDGTNVTWHYWANASTDRTTAVPHGLTISDFISVSFFVGSDSVCHVTIDTLGGAFQTTFNWSYEMNGEAFVSAAQAMTNAVATASCSDFRKPVWVFGDSYYGASSKRIFGQLLRFGYSDFLIDALAGQQTVEALPDLYNALKFGTPKYLIWGLGMNDADGQFSSYYQRLFALCDSKNITLILCKIPSVPNHPKETWNSYIEASGYKYIDFYEAVGAASGGTWYSGMLDTDNIHPTQSGAQALASRFLVDFPEIMQYEYHVYSSGSDTDPDPTT